MVASVPPMVLKSDIDLEPFEVIAEAGPGACLSPSEIASQLPIRNPDVPGPVLEIIAEAGPGACLLPSEIASQLPIRNPDAPGPVLEIIVEAGSGASLSPSEIQLPIRNPDVPGPVLEIIAEAGAGACLSPSLLIRNPDARLLPSEIASQLLFLARSLHRRPVPDGTIERLYSAGPVSNFLTKNQDVINQDKVLMESREQEINCHSVFMFLNPVLLALLQVEYQSQKVSPFQTHPANVWGFLAATCFYCLGLGLKMHMKSRSAILGHVILISGAFSSVSLVSIFLPRSLGWLPFIIWAILPFMIGRPLLMRVYRWLYQEILKVIPQVGNFFGRFMGFTTVQQQYLPVRGFV